MQSAGPGEEPGLQGEPAEGRVPVGVPGIGVDVRVDGLGAREVRGGGHRGRPSGGGHQFGDQGRAGHGGEEVLGGQGPQARAGAAPRGLVVVAVHHAHTVRAVRAVRSVQAVLAGGLGQEAVLHVALPEVGHPRQVVGVRHHVAPLGQGDAGHPGRPVQRAHLDPERAPRVGEVLLDGPGDGRQPVGPGHGGEAQRRAEAQVRPRAVPPVGEHGQVHLEAVEEFVREGGRQGPRRTGTPAPSTSGDRADDGARIKSSVHTAFLRRGIGRSGGRDPDRRDIEVPQGGAPGKQVCSRLAEEAIGVP